MLILTQQKFYFFENEKKTKREKGSSITTDE